MGINVKEINSKNFMFWNIVKGVGIISIVVGHRCPSLAVHFVYLYHLAVFFFVSGYLYSERKYSADPHFNLISRFKSSWLKFVVASVLLVIFHNTFLDLGIIINQDPFTLRQLVTNSLNSITFICTENLGGALWFIPVLIIASGLFGMTVWMGKKVYEFTGKTVLKYITIAFTGFLLGFIGIMMNIKMEHLNYHMHTSFTVIPIFTVAYFVRNFCTNVEKILKWYVALPVTAILLVGVKFFGFGIDLSAEKIMCPFAFYMISLSGIYMCLYISKVILKISYVNKFIEFLGKYSFEIMAGHFLVFKIIDVIYAHATSITDKQVYGKFPTAFPEKLWPIYVIFGAVIPALSVKFIYLVFDCIKKRLKDSAKIKQ